MNKKVKIAIVLLFLTAGVGTGIYFYRKNKKGLVIGSKDANDALKDMEMY